MSDTPDKGRELQQYREQMRQLHQSLDEKLARGDDPTAELRDKLQQVKTVIEASEYNQEVYNRTTDLLSEITSVAIAIIQNDKAKAYQQQAFKATQEVSKLSKALNKRHMQYARALQKQQQAQRAEKSNRRSAEKA